MKRILGIASATAVIAATPAFTQDITPSRAVDGDEMIDVDRTVQADTLQTQNGPVVTRPEARKDEGTGGVDNPYFATNRQGAAGRR
jgi:hypothetical protein